MDKDIKSALRFYFKATKIKPRKKKKEFKIAARGFLETLKQEGAWELMDSLYINLTPNK